MSEPDTAPPPRRIAFLAPQDLSEADLVKSIQALESAGMRIDVITAAPEATGTNGSLRPGSDPAPEAIGHAAFSALAMPAPADHPAAGGIDETGLRLVRSIEEAGKPILYVHLPAAAATTAPRPFSLMRLFADSWQRWNAIDAPRLGAALAYYTLLSLAPLLILMVSIAGVFFRRTLIQSGLMWQVHTLTGDIGTGLVNSVLQNTKSATGIIAGVLGVLTLLVGASGVFLELRDSLDTVWDVKPPYGTGLWSLVRARVFAFFMVLGTGLVLSASILMTTVLATPMRCLLRFLPTSGVVAWGVATVISLVVMTLVFGLIYKIVPDIRIRWSDVWIGAAVTSVLFTAGKWLIGLYLSRASVGSPYAAAGSLIVFLTWVYYSVQIFLFGAEFTHEYALRHGSYSQATSRPPRFRRVRRPG